MKVALLNFERGPGIPLLNFRGVLGPKVPGLGVLVPLLHHDAFYFPIHSKCRIFSFLANALPTQNLETGINIFILIVITIYTGSAIRKCS